MNEYSSNLDSIAHYGVKGMRWGVRRYQNSDGTLTSAGETQDPERKKRKNQEKAYANR